MNSEIETESQFTPNLTERTTIDADEPNYALKVAILGIMTALVTVATIVIRILIPATQGYFNFGDTIIYITAILFGAYIGGLAGGIGSGIADMIGFPPFALISLASKGLEGYVVGLVYHKFSKSKRFGGKQGYKIIAILCGAPFMIGGYFIAEIFMFGMGPALVELPWNILQALTGISIAIPITIAIEKVPQMTQITSMLSPNTPPKK
ncbi:MAG: ECF transporter S component [Promethearchaeota archaeon]